MEGIIWEPYGDYLNKSNIARFMKRHSIESYRELIDRSTSDIEWFWDAALKDLNLEWYQPYEKLLDTSKGLPWARWFIGGKINIAHNCLDRHAKSSRKDNIALIWEGDSGEVRKLTYGEMWQTVNQLANGLKSIGGKKGDRVGIYMPMVPEIVIALFACFKIGAVAIPIFSGFGASALATRLEDGEAKVIFTADGFVRRGQQGELKKKVDEATSKVSCIEHVIVYKRCGIQIPWDSRKDIWWHDLIDSQSTLCETERMEAEDTALVLYSSGTTGKPKGTVHTHAGCLAQMSKEVGYYCDLRNEDIFFWLTDIGWMMGPWEMIGVQHFGGTYMIFEGVPDYPKPDRLWDIVERHGVTILGLSPTVVRSLMRHGEEWVKKHDISRLRLLGSTGEVWDTESYLWYFEKVGGKRCPIINISGGTEIVGCFLSPLPIIPLKPCTLGGPGLGMDVDVFDEDGKPVMGDIGYLVCKKPAPSMTKGFLNDPDRYLKTYFSKWHGVWFHGDWARIDDDGYWFLHGRTDDTIKIGGKRIGPAEIETALLGQKSVSEAAVIGVPHEIKGEGIICFVVLKPGIEPTERLHQELKDKVVEDMGKAFRPEDVRFVRVLPKTRSGKIIRSLIKKRFLGQEIGDATSVENPEALEEISRAS